jgi:hypothetical protein
VQPVSVQASAPRAVPAGVGPFADGCAFDGVAQTICGSVTRCRDGGYRVGVGDTGHAPADGCVHALDAVGRALAGAHPSGADALAAAEPSTVDDIRIAQVPCPQPPAAEIERVASALRPAMLARLRVRLRTARASTEPMYSGSDPAFDLAHGLHGTWTCVEQGRYLLMLWTHDTSNFDARYAGVWRVERGRASVVVPMDWSTTVERWYDLDLDGDGAREWMLVMDGGAWWSIASPSRASLLLPRRPIDGPAGWAEPVRVGGAWALREGDALSVFRDGRLTPIEPGSDEARAVSAEEARFSDRVREARSRLESVPGDWARHVPSCLDGPLQSWVGDLRGALAGLRIDHEGLRPDVAHLWDEPSCAAQRRLRGEVDE